jgi:hypothetical protein
MIEAMKQWLEALEEACGDRCNAEYNPCHARTAIASLRQAIKQAEKQQAREPKKWVYVECPLCGEMAVAHTHPNLNKEKNT